MDKLSIIKEVEEKLDKDLLNGTFAHNGSSIPFKEFLETKFISFVKDNANVDRLIDFINNKFAPLVVIKDIDKEKKAFIESFIENRFGYQKLIQVSENEYMNVTEALLSKVPFMDDNFLITIGPKKTTIEEFYMTILNNRYKAPTIADKYEICEYYGEQLDDKVLDSIMDGMNITVRDYLTSVLPTQMVNATDIVIDGEHISIVDAIEKINAHQMSIIEEEEKRVREELEEKFNRTGENPSLLSEITVELNKENNLEVTAEIPIVASNQFTEEEVASLSSLDVANVGLDPVTHYVNILSSLKESIVKTNSLHDLETKEATFKEIANEALAANLGLYVQTIITSTEELITEVRNSIIKLEGNKEDYIDALQGASFQIKNEISVAQSTDELSAIYGEITRLRLDSAKKGIHGVQYEATMENLENYFNSVRAKSDFKMVPEDVKRNKAIADVNNLFMDLRIKQRNLESASLERDRQNINIAISVKQEQIMRALNAFVKERLITEQEYQSYSEQLGVLDRQFNSVQKSA